MPDGLCRSFFDLRLNLCGCRSIVHDDAELVALNEEAASLLGRVCNERDRLHSELGQVATDDDPNNAEQASGDVFSGEIARSTALGVLLHESEPKQPIRPRKVS